MAIKDKFRIGASVKARVYNAAYRQYTTINGIIRDVTGQYIELTNGLIVHQYAIKEIH